MKIFTKYIIITIDCIITITTEIILFKFDYKLETKIKMNENGKVEPNGVQLETT